MHREIGIYTNEIRKGTAVALQLYLGRFGINCEVHQVEEASGKTKRFIRDTWLRNSPNGGLWMPPLPVILVLERKGEAVATEARIFTFEYVQSIGERVCREMFMPTQEEPPEIHEGSWF